MRGRGFGMGGSRRRSGRGGGRPGYGYHLTLAVPIKQLLAQGAQLAECRRRLRVLAPAQWVDGGLEHIARGAKHGQPLFLDRHIQLGDHARHVFRGAQRFRDHGDLIETGRAEQGALAPQDRLERITVTRVGSERDQSCLQFIDDTGDFVRRELHELPTRFTGGRRRLRRVGGQLDVEVLPAIERALQPAVRRVIRLIGLDQRIEVFERAADARTDVFGPVGNAIGYCARRRLEAERSAVHAIFPRHLSAATQCAGMAVQLLRIAAPGVELLHGSRKSRQVVRGLGDEEVTQCGHVVSALA